MLHRTIQRAGAGRTRRHDGNADSGNIVMAVVLAVVVGGLIATLAAASLMGSKGTARDRSYTLAVHSADSGLQSAVYALNRHRNATDLITLMAAGGSGTVSGGTFTWTASPLTSTTWRITSTGGYGERTRTVHATARTSLRFPHAVFSDASTRLAGNNVVDSYDSSTPLWPALSPGIGTLGSNGTIFVSGNSTTDGASTLYDYANDPDPTRCSGGGAACTPVNTEDSVFDVVSPEALQPMTQALSTCRTRLGLAATDPLPDWRASVDGGGTTPAVFPPTTAQLSTTGPFCFRNLVFDRDTVLATGFTAGSPALVHVEGSITVRAKVRVNAPAGALTPPVSPALQIFSPVPSRIDWGAGSVFSGAVYAPKAECGEKSGGSVEIYGALVCGTFNTRGGWAIHYDRALRTVGASLFRIVSWEEG